MHILCFHQVPPENTCKCGLVKTLPDTEPIWFIPSGVAAGVVYYTESTMDTLISCGASWTNSLEFCHKLCYNCLVLGDYRRGSQWSSLFACMVRARNDILPPVTCGVRQQEEPFSIRQYLSYRMMACLEAAVFVVWIILSLWNLTTPRQPYCRDACQISVQSWACISRLLIFVKRP